MLTFEDCVGYADVDEGTIEAIAEHERLPSMVACELAQTLIHSETGVSAIRRLMEQDLLQARRQHRRHRVEEIALALARFNREHPGRDVSRPA